MSRDIDYAAEAVKKAIVEKFGWQNPTDNLQVTANEKTITVQDGQLVAEGTRDSLLAALRKAGSYDQSGDNSQRFARRMHRFCV